MARSKVKSRSHHDVAHLQSLINVPTKYKLPTPYSFRDIAWGNSFQYNEIYGKSETVQRSGDFLRKWCQLCKGPNNVVIK